MVEKLIRFANMHGCDAQPLLFEDGIVVWVGWYHPKTKKHGFTGYNCYNLAELKIVLGY